MQNGPKTEWYKLEGGGDSPASDLDSDDTLAMVGDKLPNALLCLLKEGGNGVHVVSLQDMREDLQMNEEIQDAYSGNRLTVPDIESLDFDGSERPVGNTTIQTLIQK